MDHVIEEENFDRMGHIRPTPFQKVRHSSILLDPVKNGLTCLFM